MKWTSSLKARRLDSPWIAISVQTMVPFDCVLESPGNLAPALSIWARLRHFYVIGMGSTCAAKDTPASPYPEGLEQDGVSLLIQSFSWSVFQQLKVWSSPDPSAWADNGFHLHPLDMGKLSVLNSKTLYSQSGRTLVGACVWCPGEGILRREPLRTPDLPQEQDPSRWCTCSQRINMLISLGTEILQAQSRGGEKKLKNKASTVVYLRIFIHVLGIQCGY